MSNQDKGAADEGVQRLEDVVGGGGAMKKGVKVGEVEPEAAMRMNRRIDEGAKLKSEYGNDDGSCCLSRFDEDGRSNRDFGERRGNISMSIRGYTI